MASSISQRGVVPGRRAFLAGAGAGLAALMLPRQALAEAASAIRVPQVDALNIKVVTDGLSYALAKSGPEGDVEVTRPGHFLSETAPPDKALIGEFGLSLHAESRLGADTRRVLIDFGYTPEAINNNLALLGIDVAQLDALVLSHGHYDHFGGLAGFLDKHRSALKPGIAFHLGDGEAFCSRRYTSNGKNYGVIDRASLKASNIRVVSSDDAALVAGHALNTGHIPQAGFEKVLSPTRFKPGLDDHGNGCPVDQLPEGRRSANETPDDFHHEIATAYHLRGKGLVVLTSCGHRGVVNSVKQARAASGIDKVHAVIGGFHLAPHDAAYVSQTLDGLLALDVAHIVPLHCSGEPFYELAKAKVPERLIRAYVGTTLTFTA
jgi:7,8-dihydropterin-6-yl-methyl-4-(beta-D-ribofuranosyl)aminobenzene 5'-phosphate synthase